MYPGSKPLKVLLVEDDISDSKLISDAFDEVSLFAKMNVVEDGDEAIDYLYQSGEYFDVDIPDLIILDLNIPKKNGIRLLEIFKGNDDFKRIPIIVLSTEFSTEIVKECYRLKANSFIKKPNDIDGFYELVKDIESFWLRTAKLPV